MNYQEYSTLLKRQISSQHYDSKLKFAVLICQKLFPDYQVFCNTHQWGNSELLFDGIIVCQRTIDNLLDSNDVKELIAKINLIIPDTNDFEITQVSYALNASLAIYETLEFIIDKEDSHIYNIANYYTDTIDFKIQDECGLTQEDIKNHPRMIEAWNFVIEETK